MRPLFKYYLNYRFSQQHIPYISGTIWNMGVLQGFNLVDKIKHLSKHRPRSGAGHKKPRPCSSFNIFSECSYNANSVIESTWHWVSRSRKLELTMIWNSLTILSSWKCSLYSKYRHPVWLPTQRSRPFVRLHSVPSRLLCYDRWRYSLSKSGKSDDGGQLSWVSMNSVSVVSSSCCLLLLISSFFY